MRRSLHIAALGLCWTPAADVAHSALIVNAPQPNTQRVNVSLIPVADYDGTDSTAPTFGTPAQEAEVFSLVDLIYAQAGVDVAFTYRAGTYNNSFARTGAPGANDPRPTSDLAAIRNQASSAGVLSSDPNTLNVFLVTIAPGFSQLSANSAAGLASVNANGIAYYGGENLSDFAGGREVLASVLAHEIGHNLGLDHNTISQNLMRSGGSGQEGQRLDTGQITTILASRFTVDLPPTLPGDFNGNGRVDGTDLVVWQRGGSPNRVTGGDLTLWRTNFGRTGGMGAAVAGGSVPEPSGAVMALGASLGAVVQGARRRFSVQRG